MSPKPFTTFPNSSDVSPNCGRINPLRIQIIPIVVRACPMGILFLTWIVGVGVGGSPGETFFTLSALRHSLCVVHTGGGLGSVNVHVPQAPHPLEGAGSYRGTRQTSITHREGDALCLKPPAWGGVGWRDMFKGKARYSISTQPPSLRGGGGGENETCFGLT
uniref:Uncharacterized protein n=1 Tax=Cacopsylla melanoneura TaxID=428564 RepID=A0A8D9BRI3_9HEMI